MILEGESPGDERHVAASVLLQLSLHPDRARLRRHRDGRVSCRAVIHQVGLLPARGERRGDGGDGGGHRADGLSDQRPLVPDCVVAPALQTLEAQHVEHREGRLQAVPALDVGIEVLVLRRHRSLRDLLVINLPDVRHIHHADATDGTSVVTGTDHLVKTSLVDQVIAWRDLTENNLIRM